MPDLFDPMRPKRPGAITDEERNRIRRRESARPRGYAAPPGSGPDGKACKDCAHKRLHESGARKRFWKCALIKPTKGAATDILMRSPACSRFEAPGAA